MSGIVVFLRRVPVSPLVCFGLIWLLAQTAPVQMFEWRTLDWRTKFRTHFQGPTDPRLHVVLFEDNTDAAITWPPDRSVHGDFLDLIAQAKPAVVAFDVILDARREGEGDAQMGRAAERAMRDGVKVISAAVTNAEPADVSTEPGNPGLTRPLTRVEGDVRKLLGDEHAFLPFPELRAVSWFGFADTPPGSDGIRREIPLVVRAGERVYPTLSLQTIMGYYEVHPEAVRVRLGDAVYLPTKARGELRLPISKEGRFLLNYRYDEDESGPDFATHSYIGMLVRLNEWFVEKKPGAMEPPKLAGDIVFVGQTVTGKADSGPTPLRAYSPLVLVHANLVNNVLADDYARRAPDWAVMGVALLLGYGGLVLGMRRTVWVMTAFTVLSLVVYVVAAYACWIKFSLWLPLVWPIIGFGVLQFVVIMRRVLREQRARDQVKQMFGTYLAPALVNRMIESGEAPKLGGHEADITAYFSDIEGYSTFSEKLTPPQLVELLNEYLTACTDIVQEEGGTLDKYIGDAVVAMFGAPLELPDHAYRACVAALRVQTELAVLRERWNAEGERWPEQVKKMRSRIGLNTGPAIVGNMGSRSRFNYTMTGDNVNLAARMESGAKSWGVYSMVTEATKLACERHGGDRVVFRRLGRIRVMGRAQPVAVFELAGLRETIEARTLECLSHFEAGLVGYFEQNWDAALAGFQASALLEPGKRPDGKTGKPTASEIYIGIVERRRSEPRKLEWDGVISMQEK